MPQVSKPYRIPVKLAAVPYETLDHLCELEGANRTEIMTRSLLAFARGKNLDPMKIYLERTHKDGD